MTPKDAARLDAIVLIVHEGPVTTDELRRALRKITQAEAPVASVRRACAEGLKAGLLSTKLVKSKRYRMGISLWFHAGERAEVVAAAVAALERVPGHTTFNRPPQPRVAGGSGDG